MTPIEERIGYKFRNSLLLAEALTHPSTGSDSPRTHFDNQRLEFLGDAVLQLVITRQLFDMFPELSEGELTKMRSRLVSREGLRAHAVHIGLQDFLMMGKGEETTGGRLRPSALADAFEALIGAMYLDSDFETVARFVLSEAHPDLEFLTQDPPHVNPKGKLQEALQAITKTGPAYRITRAIGPEHAKEFAAEVRWEGMLLGEGKGHSKKEAETAAALDAMARRVWEPSPSGPGTPDGGHSG
jgi:ribonuclease-3